MRESLVGLLNGVGFGLLTGVVASLWFHDPNLGLVIGVAMIVNLFAGALGGILIPLALDRYGADPAVSSGVFVTDGHGRGRLLLVPGDRDALVRSGLKPASPADAGVSDFLRRLVDLVEGRCSLHPPSPVPWMH